MDPMTHPIIPENEGILNLRQETAAIRAMNLPRNGFPIVFVPGFSGWGRPLLGTVNYFGGFDNLPLILSQLGYNVIVVRIGPISSNRERACEIFAQLRAGILDPPGAPVNLVPVDFGIAHPTPNQALLAIAETPRAVLYQASGPSGNPIPFDWQWSNVNRVNFICHSQGGTTVRCLIELLSGTSDPNFPAFLGVDRQPWVHSVATIGTPHKGTTVTGVVNDLIAPVGLDPLVDFIAACSFENRGNRVYDLHLDHWGFSRAPGQTYRQMRAAIAPAVNAWWVGLYNGFYDNSVRGITDLDLFAPNPSTHTYYFTMSFCATTPFPNERLTAQEINDFIALIPIVPNPFGLVGSLFARLQQFLGPSAREALSWMTTVANNHLGPLGYFSRIPPPGNQIPRPDVLPLLSYPAYAMGGRNIPAGVAMPGITAAAFQPNDGIVNTLSMDGPMTGPVNNTSFAAQHTAGGPTKSIYWHLGRNATIDHADQIGAFTDQTTSDEVRVMYMLFAELLDHLW